jgi:signal transduction histidine kinase
MDLTLAQVAAGWPLAASLAALGARGVYAGRRRSALNECLHELRRPLQALALAGPAAGRPESVESCLRMAAQALERLDREINGEADEVAAAPVGLESLARSALARQRARAELAGGSLEIRWRAAGATVVGDRRRLAQALDNLIANAIEHGGSSVVVEGRREGEELLLAVVDSGGREGGTSRRRGSAGLISRLRGRRRHGHGLRLVRRIAGEHGGEFRLNRSERRTEAVLRLPLSQVRGTAG